MLCLPTEKIVGTHTTKIINLNLHLLCFPVTQTPIKPQLFDQNQFGPQEFTSRALLPCACHRASRYCLHPQPAGAELTGTKDT